MRPRNSSMGREVGKPWMEAPLRSTDRPTGQTFLETRRLDRPRPSEIRHLWGGRLKRVLERSSKLLCDALFSSVLRVKSQFQAVVRCILIALCLARLAVA